MTDDPTGPLRVAFACARERIETADGFRPNWAFGFLAVLEKYRCRVEIFEDGLPDRLDDHDLVVVGPQRSPVSFEDYGRLRDGPAFVVFEAGALDAAAVERLALERLACPPRAQLRYRAVDAIAALEPFRTFLEGAVDAHPLDALEVVGRYEAPDLRRFNLANAAPNWGDLSKNLTLRQAFFLRRRWAREGLDADKNDLAALKVVALAAVAARLGGSEHGDQLRADADKMIEALHSRQDEMIAGAARLIARWKPAGEAGRFDPKAALADVLEWLDQTPVIRRALREGGDVARIRELATVHMLAALAALVVEGADARVDALSAALKDRVDIPANALRAASDGEAAQRFLGHPLATVLMACMAPDLTFEGDASGEADAESKRANDWWTLPPVQPFFTRADASSHAAAELVVERASDADGAPSTRPAVWRDGAVVMLGYPLLTYLGYGQTLPPTERQVADGNYHWAFLAEHCLIAYLNGAMGAPGLRAQEDGPPSVIVRHDVDRPIDDEDFARLLDMYAARGVRASWHWIWNRLDPDRIAALVERGHDIGLHSLLLRDKDKERSAIERRADLALWGESYHGAGADFMRGGPSALASLEAGFIYSELSPLQYDIRTSHFVHVDQDGSVQLKGGCANVTFSYSTDAAPGSRKFSVTGTKDFALAMLRAGYPVSVLNHPDMNFEVLDAFLDEAAALGAKFETAADFAWRVVARPSVVSGAPAAAARTFAGGDLARTGWRNPSLANDPEGVFMVGAPRTGSTLLMNAICSLPGMMPALPEAVPLISIVEAFRRNRRLENAHRGAFFGGVDRVDAFFREWVDKWICDLQRRYGPGRPVLKSPILSMEFHNLVRLLPNHIFICTVRHPALIARSMRVWGQKAKERGEDHMYGSASDEELFELIAQYFHPILTSKELHVAARLRFVRYEDITSGSPKALADVARLCGAEGHAIDLANPFAHSTLDGEHGVLTDDAITDLYGKGVEADKGMAELASLTGSEIALSERLTPSIVKLFYQDAR